MYIYIVIIYDLALGGGVLLLYKFSLGAVLGGCGCLAANCCLGIINLSTCIP